MRCVFFFVELSKIVVVHLEVYEGHQGGHVFLSVLCQGKSILTPFVPSNILHSNLHCVNKDSRLTCCHDRMISAAPLRIRCVSWIPYHRWVRMTKERYDDRIFAP